MTGSIGPDVIANSVDALSTTLEPPLSGFLPTAGSVSLCLRAFTEAGEPPVGKTGCKCQGINSSLHSEKCPPPTNDAVTRSFSMFLHHFLKFPHGIELQLPTAQMA